MKLQFQLVAAHFARKLSLRRDDASLFELSCNTIDHLNNILAKYTRDLLGLEAMCQLAGNSIVLLLLASEAEEEFEAELWPKVLDGPSAQWKSLGIA